jgi:hypothetical protein
MSRLDQLPPDQRAALSLLLAQRKSYAEVARMLGIPEGAVHDRAHAALAVLAPAQARALTAEEREEIGEHLLGQQPGIAERLRTRTLLGSSEPARSWAQSLAAELAPLATDALPEIPNGDAPAQIEPSPPAGASAPSAAPPPASADGRPEPAPSAGPAAPSSRLGGALILAAIVAAIVVAVVLATSGGSSHKSPRASNRAQTSTGPAITSRIEMRSPNPASRSVGLLQILAEGSKRAFYIVAEHMPATHGYFYALWLYNSPSSHEPLGKAPPVGSNHRLEGGGALPPNASEFHEVLLTRETSTRATQPGQVVLHGNFTVGS